MPLARLQLGYLPGGVRGNFKPLGNIENPMAPQFPLAEPAYYLFSLPRKTPCHRLQDIEDCDDSALHLNRLFR